MKIPEGFKTIEEYKFPNIVNVCVLRGSCPCECTHCPIGSIPKDKRVKKFGNNFMSLETFKNIADEISRFRHSSLRMHSVGEPLLWKYLEQALDYASKKRIKTWIFTSLVTHDKSLIESIAKNCSIVEISVNSIDRKDYKKTKGIENFDLVSKNIKYLSEFIKKNRLKTRLIASRVESLNKRYDKRFVKFWKNSNQVTDSFIRSYHSYNSTIKDRTRKEIRKPVPCHVHWARFNINSDGDVAVCFNELFKGTKPTKDLIFGNVNKKSIQEIWHCRKLQQIRKAQLTGDYSKIKFNLCCITCKYCQPLDTKRQTSEYQLKQLGDE